MLGRMEIEYLSGGLGRLNEMLREAFASASGLSQEEGDACRWRTLGMLGGEAESTAGQEELVARLEAAVEYGESQGLAGVVGWCMAAAGGAGVGGSEYDSSVIGPALLEFVRTHAPASGTVLDVACGTGWAGGLLAAEGYEVAFLDPAESFLRRAREAVEREGLGEKVLSLMCGSFADLGDVATEGYDVCLCLRSLLYAHPREEAVEILRHFGRIAKHVVAVDVASKHGMILQLGATFEVSAEAVVQILKTGTTPPARPENGGAVYSCFSSEELREAAEGAGLTVHRVMGFGMRETLELGTGESIPAEEARKIEAALQREEGMVDSFPSLLALCTKELALPSS